MEFYLSQLQSVISRMAGNSANCKTMSVTILAALLAFLASAKALEYAWLCLIPIVLFYFLDSYYLHLEQGFRNKYEEVVDKHHSNALLANEMYLMKPKKADWSKAILSPSTWPMYLSKAILVFVIIIMAPSLVVETKKNDQHVNTSHQPAKNFEDEAPCLKQK